MMFNGIEKILWMNLLAPCLIGSGWLRLLDRLQSSATGTALSRSSSETPSLHRKKNRNGVPNLGQQWRFLLPPMYSGSNWINGSTPQKYGEFQRSGV